MCLPIHVVKKEPFALQLQLFDPEDVDVRQAWRH